MEILIRLQDHFEKHNRKQRILILIGLFVLSVLFFRQSEEKKLERYLESKYHKSFECIEGPYRKENDRSLLGTYRFRCLEEPFEEFEAAEVMSSDAPLLSFFGREIHFSDDYGRSFWDKK